MRQKPHHPQIVGHEDHAQPEALLQRNQKVDDLRLHRDIERREDLVGDDAARFQREGAGDADALALAATRYPSEFSGGRFTRSSSSATRAGASARGRRPLTTMASLSVWPTVIRGLSEL